MITPATAASQDGEGTALKASFPAAVPPMSPELCTARKESAIVCVQLGPRRKEISFVPVGPCQPIPPPRRGVRCRVYAVSDSLSLSELPPQSEADASDSISDADGVTGSSPSRSEAERAVDALM